MFLRFLFIYWLWIRRIKSVIRILTVILTVRVGLTVIPITWLHHHIRVITRVIPVRLTIWLTHVILGILLVKLLISSVNTVIILAFSLSIVIIIITLLIVTVLFIIVFSLSLSSASLFYPTIVIFRVF